MVICIRYSFNGRIGNLLGEQNPDRAGVAAKVSMLMALGFAAISR
jgi:Na+-driven multidrug efflux pump